MLEKLRKPKQVLNLKNFVAYFVFGAIILVFIGFGMSPDRMGHASGGVAAVVNRAPISIADFRDRLQSVERQYQQRSEGLPESQRQEFTKALRNKVLDDLIVYEVVYQAAVAKGVGATDAEVASFIMNIPAFQEEGRFRRDRYEEYLKSTRSGASQFEDKIRRDLVVRKVQSLFQDALKPTLTEREKDRQAEETKANLAVASFGTDDLQKKMPVSASEIAAYLTVAGNVDKVKKIFDENQQQFAQPEQVKVRHILVRFDKTKKDYDKAALDKITELATKIPGGDFAKLATQFSDDTGSKSKGGDLGYFARGRMVPEFENAAFSLPVGQVSTPVKTEYGYHLLKVEDKKAAKAPNFDEVKGEIAKEQLAKQKTDPFVAELEAKVKAGDLGAVEKSLKDLALEWQETGDFALATGSVPQLGENDKVLEAVAHSGGKKGLVQELVKSGGRYFVVQVRGLTTAAGSSAKADLMEEAFSGRKYMDAFNNWTRAEHSHAAIQKNQELLAF